MATEDCQDYKARPRRRASSGLFWHPLGRMSSTNKPAINNPMLDTLTPYRGKRCAKEQNPREAESHRLALWFLSILPKGAKQPFVFCKLGRGTLFCRLLLWTALNLQSQFWCVGFFLLELTSPRVAEETESRGDYHGEELDKDI